MTVPRWEAKRDSDFYAPQPIVVKVGGVAQDLTDPDWELLARARSSVGDDEIAFTPTWDTDTALLEAGEVWLIISREQAADLVGVFHLDLRAQNDTLPKVKRKVSDSWTIEFVDSVTRGEVGS